MNDKPQVLHGYQPTKCRVLWFAQNHAFGSKRRTTQSAFFSWPLHHCCWENSDHFSLYHFYKSAIYYLVLMLPSIPSHWCSLYGTIMFCSEKLDLSNGVFFSLVIYNTHVLRSLKIKRQMFQMLNSYPFFIILEGIVLLKICILPYNFFFLTNNWIFQFWC